MCVYDSKHVAAGVSCVCVCIIWFVTTQSNGCFRLLFVFGSLYKLYMVLHVFYSLAVHTNDMYTCIRRLSFFSLSLDVGMRQEGGVKYSVLCGSGRRSLTTCEHTARYRPVIHGESTPCEPLVPCNCFYFYHPRCTRVPLAH